MCCTLNSFLNYLALHFVIVREFYSGSPIYFSYVLYRYCLILVVPQVLTTHWWWDSIENTVRVSVLRRCWVFFRVKGLTLFFSAKRCSLVSGCPVWVRKECRVHRSVHLKCVGGRLLPMQVSCSLLERQNLSTHLRYRSRTAHLGVFP